MFNLGTLITSKTRLDVLLLFIKNQEMELGIRETARKLDASPMLVRAELMLLEKSTLLKSRKVANSIQYSLNRECTAVEPLRKLTEASDE